MFLEVFVDKACFYCGCSDDTFIVQVGNTWYSICKKCAEYEAPKDSFRVKRK